MAYVRGQERLVYENVNDYLTTQLGVLGWLDDTINGDADPPVYGPFGATSPITLVDEVPVKTAAVKPNTVAFTSGKELTDTEEELGAAGGGLWETQQAFFIDIFGENQGIAKAIQGDVRAILTGRLSGTSRYIPFYDKTQQPPVVAPGHQLHFEDVEGDTPLAQEYQQDWRVIKVTACHEYNAVETGEG